MHLRQIFKSPETKIFLKRVITSMILGGAFWLSFIYFPPYVFSIILIGILLQIILCEWTIFFNVKHPLFWILLPIYPIMPFVLLIIMNQSPLYHNLLLDLFLCVASHDTGSYIVGNVIGRHPIAPTISPGKTWEGFFGGFVFAAIGLSLLVYYEQQKPISWMGVLGLCFVICVISLCGDLFESWLKRRAGIKDSGTILPGHGGFLDRFDGIMFAAVFFYIFKDQLLPYFG